MPELSRFYGIVIRMFAEIGSPHHREHFHAYYQGHETEFTCSPLRRLAGLIALPALRPLSRKIDPRRYNGAALVGLRGIVVKSHGGADQLAFRNAIGIAKKEVHEDVPNRIAWRDELHPALPPGYDFDGCDTRTLMEARVMDGRIVLPSRTEYRVLLLPNLTTMRATVLNQVKALVDAGAVVLGPRPQQSPSLRDLGAGDETVRRLAGALWDGKSGRVFSGISFEQLFERLGLAPERFGNTYRWSRHKHVYIELVNGLLGG